MRDARCPSLRQIVRAVVFLCIVLGTAALCCGIDAATPRYASGTALNRTDNMPLMTVYGIEQTDEHTLELILSSESPQTNLALMISNSDALTVTQDGKMCYVSLPSDSYQRAQVIALEPFEGESIVHIIFSIPNPSNWPTSHVLLGNLPDISRRVRDAAMLQIFFLGLLSMMCISSLVLYGRKPSENYLLHLVIAAGLSFINMGISSSLSGVLLTYRLTSSLRAAILAICPLQFLLILRTLYPHKVSRREQTVFRILQVTAAAVALSMVLGLLPAMLAYPYRLLAGAYCLCLLSRAIEKKSWDAVFVLCAYAVMEGLCLASFISSLYLHYGALFGLYRMIEIAHVLFLLAVTIIVNLRFAQHFSQAEVLQKELAELNGTLEAKVAARTQDLLEQQARRQTTMQNIFHDLRSPLLVLRTQIARLPETDPNKKSLDQRLSYMTKLTEELFLVSNLESGHVLFEEDDVQLDEIAEQAAAGLRLSAQAKGVQVHIDKAPAPVWGDAFRLEQAIENLVDNALHHVQAGGTINIATGTQDKEAFVSVHNTGSFISPDELPQVFERYYRSRKKHDPHSSGLGLSIAKEIVHAHGGTLHAVSSEQEGTTFTVRIPKL